MLSVSHVSSKGIGNEMSYKYNLCLVYHKGNNCFNNYCLNKR